MKIRSVLLSLAAVLLAASCSSVRVTSDWDREADFSRYRSFHLVPPVPAQKPGDAVRNPLFNREVMAEITPIMVSKGYTESAMKEDADMLIVFRAVLEHERDWVPPEYHVGRRGRVWRTKPGHQIHYKEGTLVIDIIDNARKELIWQGRPDDCRVVVPSFDKQGGKIEAALGDLKREIVTITAGQKIAYVADCSYTADNVDKIAGLARAADILFCEAAFLERDSEKARARQHLTARQAGLIARSAGVKHFIPFHFSPRYQGLQEELESEAQKAFREG